MQLLIVAATGAEIAPFTRYIQNASGMRVTCDVLIPGIGMVATTYALTKQLQLHHYDLVIQAGIGGSFDTTLALGVLVFVTSEQYGDMGAEDHDNYIDIFEMGLLQANDTPFSSGKLINPLSELHSNILLPHVSGLTVNTVSGNESSIKRRSEKYQCQVESMEGAAFHYVCLSENVPFAQIRAISNYVIPRDKSQWKMKDAIINLNEWLIGFVSGL